MWMARRPDTERDTIGGQRPNGIMPVAGDLTSTVPTTTVDPAHVRTELLTVPVARRTFSLLLRDGGITREEILQQFEVDLARMDEDDARIVRGVTDSLREALLLTETDGATVPLTVRDLERINYYVTEANVYTEFHHVASETFREEMNWGRVMSFLLFAVSFSVYSLRQGMPDSTVQSIHGWTVGVLRREPVSTFLAANNGWEGFIDFMNTLLRRLRRKHASSERTQQEDSRFWQAMAVGAIGIGAFVAFGVRQALS